MLQVTDVDLVTMIFMFQATGVDLVTIMYPWTLQLGLPVVNVTEEEDGDLTLSPGRFLTDPNADPDEPEEPEYQLVWQLLSLMMLWQEDTHLTLLLQLT